MRRIRAAFGRPARLALSRVSSPSDTNPEVRLDHHERLDHPAFRHHRRPRRRRTRSHHRLARRPDLPDGRLQLQGHRPRGRPLRPARVRQHLLAHHESDQRRARAAHRRLCTAAAPRSPCPPATPPRSSRLLNVTDTGDSIVASTSLYGGTWNIFLHTFRRLGITVRFVEPTDVAGLRRRDATTPPRPGSSRRSATRGSTCRTSAALAAAGRELGIPLFVDNTFATPYLLPSDRARRRGRHRVAHQVARRSRHLDRRHPRRRRQLRLGPRPSSRVHRARRELPRPEVLGRLR